MSAEHVNGRFMRFVIKLREINELQAQILRSAKEDGVVITAVFGIGLGPEVTSTLVARHDAAIPSKN